MHLTLSIISVVFNFVVTSSQDSSRNIDGYSGYINGNAKLGRNTLISSHNITYIDKAENMLRMPVISKYFEEHKSRRKTYKKSPKSTIQKIIKKNRSRTKRLYLNQMTSKPTQPPVKSEYDNVYVQEDSQWKEDSVTTQSSLKKKPRKYGPKIARYPMPFQKLQRKEFKIKRSVNGDDVMIINDLDEMEFLNSKDNDYNIVNAHVQRNW